MKILSMLLLLPSLAFGEFKIKDNKVEPFELTNQDMKTFISDYAKVVNKPVLASKNTIKGEVNFSTVKPISLTDFNKMFITVLGTQGLTLVDDNSFLRIINERDVRYTATKFFDSKSYPDNGQYILVRHHLKNPLASEITRNIRPFLSRYSRVINFNDGHTMIISEKGSSVKRLLAIINSLDNEIKLKEFIERKKKRKMGKNTKLEMFKKENRRLKKELKKLKAKGAKS